LEFLVHAHEFSRIRHGKRPEGSVVQDRKDSRVDADAQCDWHEGRNSKAGIATKGPQRITEIAPEIRQHLGPSFVEGDLGLWLSNRAQDLPDQPECAAISARVLFLHVAEFGF
jgi:hypothetical protein